MCGIIGIVGNVSVQERLIESLKRLEYRGYDSAGVAGFTEHGVERRRAAGKLKNLEAVLAKDPLKATVGIGHTRWATHGPPTERNAHPHRDGSGRIWVVHNGIIENYRELKHELTARGLTFDSDTDTEVLAKLIGTQYEDDLLAAVRAALARVRGAYGIAVMSDRFPGEIVAARFGSPLVLGIAPDGHYLASDPSALLARTKRVVYLEDGDVAIVQAGSYRIIGSDGRDGKRQPRTMEWDQASAEKQGYAHFMLKEAFEAPEVVANTIRGRLIRETGNAKLGGLEDHLPELSKLRRLTIVGCGSAYYAGYVGKYLLEEYAKLPVDIELASEYRYKTNFQSSDAALLAVTQSGETADTLAAVREGQRLGLLTLGMVNVVGSTIARETDAGVYNHAGPEVAVASTKAFISQVTAFVLLTLLLARKRGMSETAGKAIAADLGSLPETLRTLLQTAPRIQAAAEKFAGYDHMMYIGRKFGMPVAAEGALKLKEVAYIHAEVYAGGELKHGPIALLGADFPVMALCPQDDVYEKMISNLEEVKARGAPVVALGHEDDRHLAELADVVIPVPRVHPILQPIVNTVPLHLFAYYAGVARGHNVDRPRNLAKSVTVE